MSTMTTLIPAPRRSGVADVSDRLGGLLTNRRTVAQWWVDLTAELDNLASRLLVDSQESWRDLSNQISRDAPHMTSQLRRIEGEHEELQAELLNVRLQAGDSAGDPSRMDAISASVERLLHRLRRHQERTTAVLYDAYERDLGGESA